MSMIHLAMIMGDSQVRLRDSPLTLESDHGLQGAGAGESKEQKRMNQVVVSLVLVWMQRG